MVEPVTNPETLRALARSLISRVDADRLRDLTMEMVRIPSWPGEETAMAGHFAGLLERGGLRVEQDHACPESPSVIGRWRGVDGPVLQFDGHTDTVPVEHPAPYERDNILHGRGSADMKCGLAGIAEACR